MSLFVTLLSLFNLALAAGASGSAVRLATAQGKAGFASRRLYWLAGLLCWTLPPVAVASTLGAWAAQRSDVPGLVAPLLLAPLAWLIAMGLLFAIVDLAEDGVLDFGRGPPPAQK